jgi:hypothetical protein
MSLCLVWTGLPPSISSISSFSCTKMSAMLATHLSDCIVLHKCLSVSSPTPMHTCPSVLS